MKNKKCIICNKSFTINKYHPQQKACTKSECQRKRHLINMKSWRKNNPDYYCYDKNNLNHHKKLKEYQIKYRLEQKQRGLYVN